MFHFINDCGSILHLSCDHFLQPVFSNYSNLSKVLEQKNNVHKTDVSMVVISLLLAPSHFKTRWKWIIWVWNKNTGAFIKVSPKNLTTFPWNSTESTGMFFWFQTDEDVLVSERCISFSVFHSICKMQSIKNVSSTQQVMSSINITLGKIFSESTFSLTLILSTTRLVVIITHKLFAF